MSSAPPQVVGRPVVVFVHVHYADVWTDMCRLLAERMDVPFRLVVTSSLPIERFEEPRTPHCLGTLVVPAENRGRDVRPFLLALARVEDFDVGLKLHTKRSGHRLDGNDWREEILASLLPDPSGVGAICDAFAANPQIGLVAPDGLLLPIRDWILRNRSRMKRVAAILGSGGEPPAFADGYFAAGSMFWFRREALSAFARPDLAPLFEAEKGQFDGTVAHAVERLFALEAERRGFVALPMNALAGLPTGLSRAELLALSRASAELVSPFFRKPRIVRFLAHRLPWVLALYRLMPAGPRRLLRDGVLGSRERAS